MTKALILKTLKTLALYFLTIYLILIITNLIFNYIYIVSPSLKLVLYSIIDIIVVGFSFILFLSHKVYKKIKNTNFYGYLYSLIIVVVLTICSIIELITSIK